MRRPSPAAKTSTPTTIFRIFPAALQTCASTNFFYTANTPTDINNALIAMFDQAVSTAHLSN